MTKELVRLRTAKDFDGRRCWILLTYINDNEFLTLLGLRLRKPQLENMAGLQPPRAMFSSTENV